MGKWIRDVWTTVTANLAATAIIALLGFVVPLLVPWIGGLPISWKIVIALSSAVISVIVFLVIRCRMRKPDETCEPFIGAPEELIMNLNRVAQEQQKERAFADKVHHFSEIKASYEVRGFDGFYSVLYAGRNMSRRPSRSMVRIVGGDSAIDKELLQMRISPVNPSDTFHWEFIKEKETPFRKPFRVYFPTPLQKGNEFAFEVAGQWPGTFGRKEDYIFFPIQLFKRGIQVLRLQAILPSCPLRYEGVVLKGIRYAVAKVQPTLEETDAGCSIAVTLEKPRHLYAIWFTRGDI